MSLRVVRMWAYAGLMLALLAGSMLLFWGGPEAYAARSLRELWNLGHILYFSLLTLSFSYWGPLRRLAHPWQWLIMIALALGWGVSIELLQAGSDRISDLMDVSRDLCGSLIMLAFHPVYLGSARVLLRHLLRLLVIGYLIFHLLPFGAAVMDEMIARAQFPLLSNMSTPFELQRWDGNASRDIVSGFAGRSGSQMKIGLTTARYSGVGLKYFPADWTGYRYVVLDLYSGYEDVLEITVRIHDAIHQTRKPAYAYNDRFNRRYQLLQGWNQIRIDLDEVAAAPAGREMDLTQIADISFFASALKRTKTLYLDQVYLLPQ